MGTSDSFPNKPGVYHMEVEHDDGCPMLSGGDRCTCKTTNTSEIFTDKQWRNRQERRKAAAEARKKAH